MLTRGTGRRRQEEAVFFCASQTRGPALSTPRCFKWNISLRAKPPLASFHPLRSLVEPLPFFVNATRAITFFANSSTSSIRTGRLLVPWLFVKKRERFHAGSFLPDASSSLFFLSLFFRNIFFKRSWRDSSCASRARACKTAQPPFLLPR